jgi:hypothetical protein
MARFLKWLFEDCLWARLMAKFTNVYQPSICVHCGEHFIREGNIMFLGPPWCSKCNR